jgi:hypothetical protein
VHLSGLRWCGLQLLQILIDFSYPLTSCFSQCHYSPPTIAPLHLSLLTVELFTLEVSFTYFIPAPGLTNQTSSKSLFNRWLQRHILWHDYLPRWWLYVVIFPPLFFYDPTYASLLACTLPRLIFTYLLGYRHLPEHYTKDYNDSITVGMCL